MGDREIPVRPLLALSVLSGLGLATLRFELEPPFVATLLAALILEVASTSIARGTFLGLSSFAYVAALWSTNWGWTTVCLLLALAVRALARGSSRAWIIDALIVQASLAFPALLLKLEFQPLLAAFALLAGYWLAATELPAQLSGLLDQDQRVRFCAFHESTVAARVGAVLLALLMARSGAELVLAAAVALTILQRFFDKLKLTAEGRDRLLLEKQLSGVSAHLESSQTRLAETREQLERTAEENSFLQRLTGTLLEQRSYDEAVDRLLESARELSGASSVAFFKPTEEGLFPQRHLGAELDTEAIRLAALSEPLVEKVWRSAAVEVEDYEGTEQGRIFSQHRQAVALPVGEVGVLYLGFRQPAQLTAEKHILLSSLAGLSALALQMVEALEQRSRALETSEDALRRLRESESQLLQSSKLAAVGQLAAGVAHELNTPLGSVLMSVDMAMDGLPPAAQQPLEVAIGELEKARDIVAKLLLYSRPKSAGVVEMDLRRVVEDTLLLIGRQLNLAGLEVKVEFEGPASVRANPTEVQQILINLLLNARDALAGVASPRVSISAAPEPQGYSLIVSDNGPGVDQKVMEQIFDPFFTTKPVGSGTGLGLSVSRELAVKNGGQLDFCPSSQGASFKLTLTGCPDTAP